VLAAFALYWIVWCFELPIALLGRREVLAMFRPGTSRFGQPPWLWAGLFAIRVLGGITVKTVPALTHVLPRVVLVSLAFVIPNAIGEEILWRGTFQRLLPGRLVLGWLYPAAMFVLWHLAPTSVLGADRPAARVGGAADGKYPLGELLSRAHGLQDGAGDGP
jgi:hypothetical protein